MRLLLTCILVLFCFLGYSQTQSNKYILVKKDYFCDDELFRTELLGFYHIKNDSAFYYRYNISRKEKLEPFILKKDTLFTRNDSLYITISNPLDTHLLTGDIIIWPNFNPSMAVNDTLRIDWRGNTIYKGSQRLNISGKDYDTYIFCVNDSFVSHYLYVGTSLYYIDKFTGLCVKNIKKPYKYYGRMINGISFEQSYYKEVTELPIIEKPEDLILFESNTGIWTKVQKNALKKTYSNHPKGKQICNCIFKTPAYFYDYAVSHTSWAKSITVHCWDKYNKK